MIKEIKYNRTFSMLLNILNMCTSAYITDNTYYFYIINGMKQMLFYVQDDGEVVFSSNNPNFFDSYSDIFCVDLGLSDKEVKDFINERFGKRNKI